MATNHVRVTFFCGERKGIFWIWWRQHGLWERWWRRQDHSWECLPFSREECPLVAFTSQNIQNNVKVCRLRHRRALLFLFHRLMFPRGGGRNEILVQSEPHAFHDVAGDFPKVCCYRWCCQATWWSERLHLFAFFSEKASANWYWFKEASELVLLPGNALNVFIAHYWYSMAHGSTT